MTNEKSYLSIMVDNKLLPSFISKATDELKCFVSSATENSFTLKFSNKVPPNEHHLASYFPSITKDSTIFVLPRNATRFSEADTEFTIEKCIPTKNCVRVFIRKNEDKIHTFTPFLKTRYRFSLSGKLLEMSGFKDGDDVNLTINDKEDAYHLLRSDDPRLILHPIIFSGKITKPDDRPLRIFFPDSVFNDYGSKKTKGETRLIVSPLKNSIRPGTLILRR